jgi:hypothetical protein
MGPAKRELSRIQVETLRFLNGDTDAPPPYWTTRTHSALEARGLIDCDTRRPQWYMVTELGRQTLAETKESNVDDSRTVSGPWE